MIIDCAIKKLPTHSLLLCVCSGRRWLQGGNEHSQQWAVWHGRMSVWNYDGLYSEGRRACVLASPVWTSHWLVRHHSGETGTHGHGTVHHRGIAVYMLWQNERDIQQSHVNLENGHLKWCLCACQFGSECPPLQTVPKKYYQSTLLLIPFLMVLIGIESGFPAVV